MTTSIIENHNTPCAEPVNEDGMYTYFYQREAISDDTIKPHRLFCIIMEESGFFVKYKESSLGTSIYVTIKNIQNDESIKVMFSSHKTNIDRGIRQDCDFYFGASNDNPISFNDLIEESLTKLYGHEPTDEELQEAYFMEKQQEPELEDGVYFNLDFDVYAGINRFSNSGISEIGKSITDYWNICPMNREKTKKESKSLAKGNLFHIALLEKEIFEENYVIEHKKSNHPFALQTDIEVKKVLVEDYGIAKKDLPKTIKEKNALLRSKGYKGKILSEIKEEYDIQNLGKNKIPSKSYKDAKRCIKIFGMTRELKGQFLEGENEVTILWTDKESGVKFKSRIDKLQKDVFYDIKTFTNQRGIDVHKAIISSCCSYNYTRQAYLYQKAIKSIKDLDLKIMGGEPSKNQIDLIDYIKSKEMHHNVFFVFVDPSNPRNRYVKMMCVLDVCDGKEHKTEISMKAQKEVEEGIESYKNAIRMYGFHSPWDPIEIEGCITSDDFSSYYFN